MEPKIRFKGFEGEWKTSTIGEIAPLSGGYAFQSNHFSSVGIPIVRISNILETGIVGGVFAKYAPFDGDADFRLYDGDAVIAMSGATTGKVAIVHTQGFLYQNQRVGKFTKTDRVIYDFLTTIVKSHKFRADLSCLLTSSAQPNASSKDIDSITQSIPLDKDEQQAIGKYFTSLDSQISASTSRLASLKQMKAASLQAMFPQEGETVPKIRFKGFEGEWKKVKFSELYERSSIKNDLSFGTDKIISVANMYFIKNSRQVDDDYLRSYNIMRLGDIAFEGNKSKNFAHGRLVENTIGDGIVSHVFIVMKPISKNYDLNFWKYYINNENIMGNILVRSTKSSTMMTDLVVDDFLKESILVPSYEEQIEIGKILTSLDRQISLQSQRLEKLKQIKSACLDKMFV